jgi:hypothetical protein
MPVYQLDPLKDPRWAELVERHPSASVFHTTAWLRALEHTYGYRPVAFTTSAPGMELRTAVVFCEIRSWLTGSRLVSLPFSDHCDDFVEDNDHLASICAHVDSERQKNGWRYIELRPRSTSLRDCGLTPTDRFCFHSLDLRPGSGLLFQAFHKDSVQRKIRRAEREHLVCEEGRSEELLTIFYRLFSITRRRHRLPPQPFEWFRNLANFAGPAMTIRIARYRARPIAAILTLRHRDTVVYKYGASEAAFHNLGGVHFLFWKTIQDAVSQGCSSLDMGRSDLENTGLLIFKDRWGAARSLVTYWRTPPEGRLHRYVACRAKQALAHMPSGLRTAAGRLLYRHVG